MPRTRYRLGLAALALGAATGLWAGAGPAPGLEARPAACAGTWYPGDPQGLADGVDRLLAEAAPGTAPPAGQLRALLVPHAAYRYSGAVAAAAYRTAQGSAPQRVIVLGPAHRGAFRGLAIDPVAAYTTPLGRVPLDQAAIQALRRSPLVHAEPAASAPEHSLEVQLPFLQRVLAPGWQLLPVLVGALEGQDYARAGELLRPYVDGATLVVVSGDFTHYGPRFGYLPFPPDGEVQERLRRLDLGAFERIAARDPEGLRAYARDTGITACALGPTLVLLAMLPADSTLHLLKYATSGALEGDFTHSVSYIAAAVSGPRPASDGAAPTPGAAPRAAASGPEQPLSQEEMDYLHRLARQRIAASVAPRGPAEAELDALLAQIPERLRRPAGAFVALRIRGELRGCIGSVEGEQALYRTVLEHAEAAALRDPRFAPVDASELPELELTLSVLSPLRSIASYRDFEPSRHGVVMRWQGRRATYLPEVAAEQGWDREQTLTHLAEKAGLPPDAWRRGAELAVYSTQTYAGPARGRAPAGGP